MKVAQSYLTLYDPVDYSPPGSSVHGILQARILKWVAMPSSRDLPDQGIECRSPALQADFLPFEPLSSSRKALKRCSSPSHTGWSLKMHGMRGFPGGPMLPVKIPCFQWRGVGLIPGQGSKIPHAACPSLPPPPPAKKENAQMHRMG